MSTQREPPSTEPPDWFTTTHWSVVQAAGTGAAAAAREALEKLCADYWQPLYGYIRRKGHSPHEAEDLTQEFFARLLSRDDFAGLHPTRGKFRAFLLGAMNHFLAKEWRRSSAQKRGGGRAPLSLDATWAEQRHGAQTAGESAPEVLFDRRWAETVLERAALRLRDEFADGARATLFRELNAFLSVPAGPGDYAAAAARLQMTPSAVAKSVERMRRRYRDLVRAEIAQTVSTEAELEEELRYLLEVLA